MPKKITIGYEEAKKIVITNNIKSLSEYNKWDKREGLGLPAFPRFTYKNSGWSSPKEFFGIIKPSLQEIKKILEDNNIRNHTDYINWDKRKELRLPSNLGLTYKEEGFTNIATLMGVGHKSLSEQSIWIQNNTDIKSGYEFNLWMQEGKRPSFISSHPPRKFYNLGWTSWDDFLGLKGSLVKKMPYRHKGKYSYAEFKIVMLASNFFGSPTEYADWTKAEGKKYSGLPVGPPNYYKDEWESWEEVGVNRKLRYYYSLDNLIKLLAKNKITTIEAYTKFQKTDKLIPSNPLLKYPELERSFMPLFGKESVDLFEYLSYEDAQAYIGEHLIFSAQDYNNHQKNMETKILPSNPTVVWADEWLNWEEFLGFSTGGSSLCELRVKCELDSIFGQSVKYKNSKEGVSEIDIFYPDINLGIEYNGAFWHYQKQDKDKLKFQSATNLGITLVHILENSSQYSLDIINEDLDVRTVKVPASHLDLLETIQLLVLNLMVSDNNFDDATFDRMVGYLTVDEYQANHAFESLLFIAA